MNEGIRVLRTRNSSTGKKRLIYRDGGLDEGEEENCYGKPKHPSVQPVGRPLLAEQGFPQTSQSLHNRTLTMEPTIGLHSKMLVSFVLPSVRHTTVHFSR